MLYKSHTLYRLSYPGRCLLLDGILSEILIHICLKASSVPVSSNLTCSQRPTGLVWFRYWRPCKFNLRIMSLMGWYNIRYIGLKRFLAHPFGSKYWVVVLFTFGLPLVIRLCPSRRVLLGINSPTGSSDISAFAHPKFRWCRMFSWRDGHSLRRRHQNP